MSARRASLLLVVVAATSCATLAGEGRGDVDLPSLLAGPFRALKHGEVCEDDVCVGVDELPPGTPNGVVSAPRASRPTVLVRGSGQGGDLRVVLYARSVTGTAGPRIVRMEAPDARSFDDVVDVLAADREVEGGDVTDPWAIEVPGASGAEVWLYYAVPATGAPGQLPGIWRARSTDGLEGRAFVRDDAPALGPDGDKGAWETDPPRAPSVVRLDDGTFRLFYASGTSIGEAASADGASFARVGTEPVVVPSAPVDPATLPEGVRPPFDDAAVDDPSAFRFVTELGRVQWGLHYTGRDLRGGSSVGFAGRFGDAGAFERKEGFVFGGKLFGDPDGNSHANAPALARFGELSLLYADIDQSDEQRIGIGIAPQNRYLPIE